MSQKCNEYLKEKKNWTGTRNVYSNNIIWELFDEISI